MINGYLETIIVLILINSIFALSLNLILGFNGQFSLGHAAFLAIGAYTSAIIVAALGMPFLLGVFLGGVFAALLGLVTGVPTLRLRGDYLAIATLGFAEIVKIVLLILPENYFGGATGIPGGAKEIDRVPQLDELLRIPGIVSQEYINAVSSGTTSSMNLNQIMNLVFAIFWILAFAVVALYGAYVLYRWLKGILLRRFGGSLFPIWALRIAYFGGIAWLIALKSRSLNDQFYRLFEIHRFHSIDSHLSSQWTVFLFLIVTVAFVTWLCCNYLNSTYGRAVMAIREDEIASTMLGINEFKFKLMNFLVGSFFAGIAGGLLAHSIPAFNPFEFDLFKSVDVLLMVVLGGMGSVAGTFFGATIITILPEALRQLGQWRMVIYSLTLVLLMIFKPSGLLSSSAFRIVVPGFIVRLRERRNGMVSRRA